MLICQSFLDSNQNNESRVLSVSDLIQRSSGLSLSDNVEISNDSINDQLMVIVRKTTTLYTPYCIATVGKDPIQRFLGEQETFAK
jgi:hypothetical protein